MDSQPSCGPLRRGTLPDMDEPGPHNYGVLGHIVPARAAPAQEEETVDSLAHTAAAVLDRDASPALTLDELHHKLEAEIPHRVPGREHLVRTLQAHPDILRILFRPDWGWPVKIGPEAWVLNERPGAAEEHAIRSIGQRLRRSVIALGQEVEPGSMLSWARWNRLIAEERHARESLGPDRPTMH